MAELKTRKKHEAELRRLILKMSREHSRELKGYLRTAKSLEDIPEEFWRRVERDIADPNDEKAALLALIFQLSAEQHAASIQHHYPLSADVAVPAAVVIGAAAAKYARKRLKRISGPYVVWTRQLVQDALEELGVATDVEDETETADADEDDEDDQEEPAATSAAIDEALKKVLGPERANRLADTEANLSMIGGGEFVVDKSKIAVVRFWAHSKLRPERHSNAEKKPCPICSPREGKAEADWDGKAPGHCHPNCDCNVLYVDEYGNIIGDDDNESDTFERYKDRLPPGFLKPREQLFRDHPEILEAWDPAKHPRGNPHNAGQFTSAGLAVETHLQSAIAGGVEVRSARFASVDAMEFAAERPDGFVDTKLKLFDGTKLNCTLHFEIVDGTVQVESVDSDYVGHSKGFRTRLEAIGINVDAADDARDQEYLNAALEQHSAKLLTSDVLQSIRAGIVREIKVRKADNELGPVGDSVKSFLRNSKSQTADSDVVTLLDSLATVRSSGSIVITQ